MKSMYKVIPIILLLVSCGSQPASMPIPVEKSPEIPLVSVVGEMRRVMHNGELSGTIHLDTLSDKTHLYGLGPVEYLKGEILIADGISYVSNVVNDSVMSIKETFDVKAPFFVYSNVGNWFEKQVPDSVQTTKQLELFLDEISQEMQRPFAFRITGEVDSSAVHIVNLPEGSEVHSPEDAHLGQQVYSIENCEVEIIGFFSTEHAGVFIHHDSFVHMHLITADKKQMGHVDFLRLSPGKFKLYLPEK